MTLPIAPAPRITVFISAESPDFAVKIEINLLLDLA
jgi:hypothetical protein